MQLVLKYNYKFLHKLPMPYDYILNIFSLIFFCYTLHFKSWVCFFLTIRQYHLVCIPLKNTLAVHQNASVMLIPGAIEKTQKNK